MAGERVEKRKFKDRPYDQHRKHQYKKLYGITLEEYNEMFDKQGGACAICRRHQMCFKKRLHVDHCHRTGKIRGLLCQRCNMAIGLLDDCPARARWVSEYLL